MATASVVLPHECFGGDGNTPWRSSLGNHRYRTVANSIAVLVELPMGGNPVDQIRPPMGYREDTPTSPCLIAVAEHELSSSSDGQHLTNRRGPARLSGPER